MIIDEIKKIFCIQRLDEKQRIFFLLYLNSDRNIVDLDLVRHLRLHCINQSVHLENLQPSLHYRDTD